MADDIARQAEPDDVLFDQLGAAVERLRNVPPGIDNAKEYQEVCAIHDALIQRLEPTVSPPRRRWGRRRG